MDATHADLDWRMVDDTLFFWGGPFSQWYPEFNEATAYPALFMLDRHVYFCAEQWMMAEKARTFNDAEHLALIQGSGSQPDIKQYGRSVRGFDAAAWSAIAPAIVFRGNLAKFSQNRQLRDLLLSTGDTTIAEASPDDRIWGIGYRATDPEVTDRAKWGQNLLGITLMRVRGALRTPPADVTVAA